MDSTGRGCHLQRAWLSRSKQHIWPNERLALFALCLFADEGRHEFSTLHRDYSTTTIFECSGNEASIASCPSLTVEEATCQFLLVDCQNNEKTNDDPNGDNTDEGIDSTGHGINSNETGVISVGDGRDKGEDSDSGEDGDFGEGGDKDSGASGDNKDPSGDKTGAGSGGGRADDGNKNSGSDRDVLSSGSGSNPTVDNIGEKTSVPPEVRPTTGQTHTVSVAVFSAITTSVVVVLFLVFAMVFLLVYMKRRGRRAASCQVGDSTKGESVGERGGGGGEKHLDNPIYDASMESPNCSQGAEITEHNVVNPLYNTNSDSTDAGLYAVLEAPNYAVLEGPDYAMPGQVCPPCSATETLNIDDRHNYDYADIPDGKTNVV